MKKHLSHSFPFVPSSTSEEMQVYKQSEPTIKLMASTSFPKKKKRYLVIKEANQVFWYVVIRIELFQHVIATVPTPVHLTISIYYLLLLTQFT